VEWSVYLTPATLRHLAWLYDEDAVPVKSLSSMCPEKPEAVPLSYAAKFGFRDLAEHLIAEHPDHVNARDGSYGTPMHAAARAGHIDIISLLLEHGAYVDARNNRGETPLLRAAWAGKRDAGWYPISHGADINSADYKKFTPVFLAFKGDVTSARILIERGAEIHIRNIEGDTPLHQAIRWGEIELVRLFLKHGANPNLPNYYSRTPTNLALLFDLPEIAELLSEYGAYW
jgi:ankyrin repeat protein